MKVYDFKVLLEPDEETGGYVVSRPSLPGCYTQGDTIDEALENNIKEAILLCLEDMQAQNQPIPDTSRTLISSVAIVSGRQAKDCGRAREMVWGRGGIDYDW